MNNCIVIGGIIESFATRQDKSIKVVFSTNEITPEKTAQLITFNQKFCYIALKIEEFKSQEIELLNNLKTDFEDIKTKSHSQRLRNVFFILWKKNNEGFINFTDYYDNKMAKVINHYKTKIDD